VTDAHLAQGGAPGHVAQGLRRFPAHVQQLAVDLVPAQQAVKASDHLAGALALLADLGEDFAQGRRLVAALREQQPTCLGVDEDRAERLVDLVGEARGDGLQGIGAREVAELQAAAGGDLHVGPIVLPPFAARLDRYQTGSRDAPSV
jgi:hypothetical protein